MPVLGGNRFSRDGQSVFGARPQVSQLDGLALSLSPAIYCSTLFPADVTLSSGKVSQWNDRSGNGRHLTQGTATRRWTPEYVNGRVALRGANDLGVNSTWMSNASFANALTAYTQFVVVAPTAVKINFAGILACSDGTIPDSTGPAFTTNDTNVNGEAQHYANSATPTLVTTHGSSSTLELLTVYNDGQAASTLSIQRDQQAPVTTTIGQFTSASSLLVVGTRIQAANAADPAYSYTGAFSLVLFFPVKLSAANIALIQSAIRADFGTA